MGEYYPHGHQLMFHAAADKIFIRAAICGTGSGKTLSGCAEALRRAVMYPGSVGYIFEPSYRMVTRVLISNTLETRLLLGRPLDSNPIITAYHRGDLFLEFTNGSRIYFQGLEDPERAEGPNIDWAMIDEGRLVRKLDDALHVIRRRLRGSDPSRAWKPALWLTTTPDAPGSTLHQFLEDPRTRHPDSMIFRWGVKDNIFLSDGYIKDMMRAHSGGYAERFIYGRFAAVASGSFEFDYTKHVLDYIDRTRLTKIVYGVDFGWTNPSAILAVGFDGDGRAYALDELYQNRLSDEQLIAEAQNMVSEYGDGEFICDSSEPQTIDKMNKAGLRASGNRSKRDDGIREVGSRFKLSEDKRYRLYIHSRCVNFISELQTYDADKKENDHLTDCSRYAILGGWRSPIQASSGKRKNW